jgi:hypothetical protein
VTDRPGTSVPHPFTEKENDGGELVMYVKKARKKKPSSKRIGGNMEREWIR